MNTTLANRNVNELHPKLKELAEKLVEECKKQNIPIIVTETYRSVERQDYLYAQGRTRSGAIITNAKGIEMSSYHQWRLAFDVCVNIKGKEYDPVLLAKIGAMGQRLGLEWGGGWSGFKDSPHFQYTFGLTIQDLKLGKKPPIASAKQVSKEIKPPDVQKNLVSPKTYAVSINTIDIKINGNIKKVEAINIEGTNYIKLRDISSEQIKVGYVDGVVTLDT